MVSNKHVVGAHYGTRDWLGQRITAVIMATYTLVLVALIFMAEPGYAGWSGIFNNQFMKIATFVVLLCLFLHVWVGMRDLLMDYIKPTAVRLTLQVAVIIALVAYVGWAIHILWGMR